MQWITIILFFAAFLAALFLKGKSGNIIATVVAILLSFQTGFPLLLIFLLDVSLFIVCYKYQRGST